MYESLPSLRDPLHNSHGAKADQKKKVTAPFPLSFFLVFLALLKAMQGDEKHSFYHELSLFACMHTKAGLH